MTGHIAHHAANSLIFALPAPGSQPKRSPLPWDAAQPYKGLGFRQVEAEVKKAGYVISERTVPKGQPMTLKTSGFNQILLSVVLVLGVVATAAWVTAPPQEEVMRVSAKKFAFTPGTITLKLGVPVIMEFTTEDVLMGFNVPDLELRADMLPGVTTRVRVVPGKVGTFTFYCDVFCGAGHEEMSGMITVVE